MTEKADEGASATRVPCEICGRERGTPATLLTNHLCWGDGHNPELREECLRLGYEREKAAREKAERSRDELLVRYDEATNYLEDANAEVWRLRSDGERRDANICSCGYPRSDHTPARGCVELFLYGPVVSNPGNAAEPPSSDSNPAESKGKP